MIYDASKLRIAKCQTNQRNKHRKKNQCMVIPGCQAITDVLAAFYSLITTEDCHAERTKNTSIRSNLGTFLATKLCISLYLVNSGSRDSSNGHSGGSQSKPFAWESNPLE